MCYPRKNKLVSICGTYQCCVNMVLSKSGFYFISLHFLGIHNCSEGKCFTGRSEGLTVLWSQLGAQVSWAEVVTALGFRGSLGGENSWTGIPLHPRCCLEGLCFQNGLNADNSSVTTWCCLPCVLCACLLARPACLLFPNLRGLSLSFERLPLSWVMQYVTFFFNTGVTWSHSQPR